MNRSAALNCYEKVIAELGGVELKGDTMPYTSLNGHMFSVLHKDGSLALRLPEAERQAFLKKYKTTLSSQYGTVQPEYVVVGGVAGENERAGALLRDESRLCRLPQTKADDQEEAVTA